MLSPSKFLYKEKNYKVYKDKDYKYKDHKVYKDKDHKDKDYMDKDHKVYKDKDYKDKVYKDKDKEFVRFINVYCVGRGHNRQLKINYHKICTCVHRL